MTPQNFLIAARRLTVPARLPAQNGVAIGGLQAGSAVLAVRKFAGQIVARQRAAKIGRCQDTFAFKKAPI